MLFHVHVLSLNFYAECLLNILKVDSMSLTNCLLFAILRVLVIFSKTHYILQSSPASYFGSREPTLVDEENQYLSFDFTRRQSDIFSYDPKFTCPEEEDEAKKFR